VNDVSDTKKPNFLKAQLNLQARILYSTLPDHLKPTALAYAQHMNNHSRKTWPSVSRIAELLGKDRRTIGRNLTELEALKVFVPHRARTGGRGEAGVTPYSINVDELHANCDIDVAVSDSTGDLPYEENCDTDVAVSDSTIQETATPVAETATSVAGNCDTGVAGTVRTELSTELRTFEVPTQIERDQEQQRKNRAATPEVISVVGWGIRSADRAAFDAELATLPIHGPFASPALARKVGYHVFDQQPGAPFNDNVDRLMTALHQQDIATSVEQCRLAMADVYQQRSMRDRTWDRGADRDRRAGRR